MGVASRDRRGRARFIGFLKYITTPTCINFPMKDSQGGSTVQNTNDMLPGQENKKASALFCNLDLQAPSLSRVLCLQTIVDFPDCGFPEELKVTKNMRNN